MKLLLHILHSPFWFIKPYYWVTAPDYIRCTLCSYKIVTKHTIKAAKPQ